MIRATDHGVAVTGLGCLCAAGASLQESVASLMAGRRNVRMPAADTADRQKAYPLFALSDAWLPAGYWDVPEVRRSGLLAIAAVRQALDDAGLDDVSIRSRRVGICLGTTVGSAMNNEAFYRAFREGQYPGMDTIRAFLQANPADMVARHFGLNGPRQTINNACASGSVAIGEAASWVRQGVCDIAIAGGTDFLCRVICEGFASLLITDPQPCRPFDRDRKGLNLGEGAAAVVLESQQSLEQRSAPVAARLAGYGNACDAYHVSAPKPDGAGLRTAILQALDDAGVGADAIAFVNAHGTGTAENDKVEGHVLPEVLPRAPFVSTKGYTGHTLGAAGAIEAALTIAFLAEGAIPGNIGFAHDDPEFAGRPVNCTTPVEGEYALSNSVAFGGNNAALVFRREPS